jgi:hypothetical protein
MRSQIIDSRYTYSDSVKDTEHGISVGYHKHVRVGIDPGRTSGRLQDAVASLLKKRTHQAVISALLYAIKVLITTNTLSSTASAVKEIKRLPQLY